MFLIVVPRTTQRKTKKKNISSRSDTGLACSEASVQEETGSMLEQKKTQKQQLSKQESASNVKRF